MRNLRYFVIVVIMLFTLACGVGATLGDWLEQGEITFVEPSSGKVFHDANTGVLSIGEVTLASSFDDVKEVTLSVDGFFWTCYVQKGNNPCPGGQLQAPGNHVIRAETTKRNGSIVSTETSVSWVPYSSVDIMVANLFGSSDPTAGYYLLGGIVIVGLVITLSIKGGKLGAVFAFIACMVILALFFLQSGATGPALAVAQGLFGVVAGAFVVFIIYTWITRGGSVHVAPFVEYTDGNRRVRMGQGIYLGPADRGPDLSRMGDSAARAISAGDPHLLPSENQQVLDARPEDDLPMLEPSVRRRGFFSRRNR